MLGGQTTLILVVIRAFKRIGTKPIVKVDVKSD